MCRRQRVTTAKDTYGQRRETRDVVAGLSFRVVLDVSSISAVLVISECGRLVKAQCVRASDAGSCSIRVVRHPSCYFLTCYITCSRYSPRSRRSLDPDVYVPSYGCQISYMAS